MKNRTGNPIGMAVVLILSILVLFLVIYKFSKTETTQAQHNFQVGTIDTVEVITEYDGDREIRWYTLDTIKYQSIDTIIMTYDWGREEIYLFKYKDDTTKN